MKPTFYCQDFELDCCNGCHEEWEDGFGEPFEEEHSEFIWVHCCTTRAPLAEVMKRLNERIRDEGSDGVLLPARDQLGEGGVRSDD